MEWISYTADQLLLQLQTALLGLQQPPKRSLKASCRGGSGELQSRSRPIKLHRSGFRCGTLDSVTSFLNIQFTRTGSVSRCSLRFCRERKKAKQQDASQKVDGLTQQMQDFEGLSAEVRELEQRNLALEADLWSKEAELNRIKCVPACLSSGVQAQRALFQRPQRYLKKLVRGAYKQFHKSSHLTNARSDWVSMQ